VKHGVKNSPMLMDIENIVYKGKSLHVHRNNKKHILENQNSKHSLLLDPFELKNKIK
jgi:hypothetical protein